MGRKLALTQTTYGVLTGAGWQAEQAMKATHYGDVWIEREGARTVLHMNPAPFAGVGALARVENGSSEMPKFRGEIV